MKINWFLKSCRLLLPLATGCFVASASTFTVTITNNSGPGSLQAIISQVNATPGDHTVEFAVPGTLTLGTALPVITNNVTINGRDAVTLSGGGRVRLLAFGSNVTAKLANLNLVKGYSSANGGAISNAGNLTIESCVLSGNRTDGGGGAIYNSKGASLHLAQSTISSNIAGGSAFYVPMGGGIYSEGNLSASTVSFDTNAAGPYTGYYAWGGALYVKGTNVAAALTNCSFSSNLASAGSDLSGTGGNAQGGAVHVESGATVTAVSCVFASNQARGGFGKSGGNANGGAINVEVGANLTAASCAFSSNLAEGTGGSGASSFGGMGYGGAIRARNNGVLSLAGCVFYSNQAKSGYATYGGDAMGGAIHIYDGANLAVTNSTFSANRASASSGTYGGSAYGGAITAQLGGILLAVNCTISSNSCTAGNGSTTARFGSAFGGGVYNDRGQIRLLNTIVAANAYSPISQGSGPDLYGAITSLGYNLIGNNSGATGLSANDYQNEPVLLGPLQDNGGPTLTHALLAGAIAIDKGATFGAPALDQRGVKRPQGKGVDIGAFEFYDPSALTDSDHDGLTDAEETNVYHTDPFQFDTDGDGYGDGVEVQAKSDPKDANSLPEIMDIYTAVELEIVCNLGHQYQLESSTNASTWAAWGPVFDGVGGKTNVLVSSKAAAKTYWRLKRVQ